MINLAREQYAMETRRCAEKHKEKFASARGVDCRFRSIDLKAREHIQSIAEAKTGLKLLQDYHEEKDWMDSCRVSDLNAIGAMSARGSTRARCSQYTYGGLN